MPVCDIEREPSAPVNYVVEYRSGKRELHGVEPPALTISVADRPQLERVLKADAYSAALGFIHREYDISGDLVAAVHLRRGLRHPVWRDHFWALAARFSPSRIETWFQGRKQAAENIRFHYDVPMPFYQAFLDSHPIYSAAAFQDARWSLDQAQEAKLKEIREALELRAGERFLEVGCGWGALVVYGADCYKVRAKGCTLSRNQRQFGRSLIRRRGLENLDSIEESDYRDLSGRFDKIASVGMFEHVGRHRLDKYFQKIYSLFESGGRFLNSGIARPRNVSDGAQTWLVLKKVFPGGELPHLSDVVRAAEKAGLEILRVENRRTDDARTCREWVDRLRQNENVCIGLVGEETYRTWLLYLAGSAATFDADAIGVFPVLMRKG